MDIKADDTLNIVIDPAFLLSYELDKLNLDSIPNDIFDEIKLADESLKNDDKTDSKKDLLLKDKKVTESTLSKFTEIKVENTSSDEDELYNAEVKDEIHSEYLEIKKDVNGNDESVSEESLNELFVQLELSDSDNEEIEDANHLKERGGPEKVSKNRRADRNKDAKNIWYKTDDHDKAQFNSERLKFLSGSSQIQISESAVPNQCTLYNNRHTTIFDSIEPIINLSNHESYFDDARASSVSSPESGYDSSSAHSIAGSPPPLLFTASGNLEFIPENEDDQNILEFLMENADDSALMDSKFAECNINDTNAKQEIKKIYNYLKDNIPFQRSEPSNATTSSDNLIDIVPFPIHASVSTSPILKPLPLSSTSDLKPVSLNVVSKQVEPKKLVPKLIDKAKGTLRLFLSQEEYYDAKKRIYEKIREDKNDGKTISVIYVEDEMDKDSKNRTNLHNAVLNGKIEDIFSIIEINKQYNLSFAGINIRDKNGKTALDYAIENQMTLVADYLKENTACQSVNLEK